MDPNKFKPGDQVRCKPFGEDDTGVVCGVRRLQGEWWYLLQLQDGYFTDPDGTVHYNSNRIKYSDWILEEELQQ